MFAKLLVFAGALAACTPSPRAIAMTDDRRDSPIVTGSFGDPPPVDQARAAQEPIAEPTSASTRPAPGKIIEPPAAARGRLILSTAFVRMGPDQLLTVEAHDGQVRVLRDVSMNRKDYCGAQVLDGTAGVRYCGRYGDVAAARPGGQPPPQEPELSDGGRLDASSSAAERK
jgi:hypothetical protein